MKKLGMMIAWAMGLAVVVQAAVPLQMGLFGEPLQIFGEDAGITGLKLNLPYAANDIVKGLDLGLVSGGGEFSGIRVNVLNFSESRSAGLEWGGVNWNAGEVAGLQLGLFNRAEYAHGLQVGLVNYANYMHGLQIGIFNCIAHTPSLNFFPFINWNF